jgi:hypothetical protein
MSAHGKDKDAEEPMDLEFITFTDIQQTKDRETKKKVRGHVMRGIQRSVRQAKAEKEKDGRIVLDTSYLLPSEGSGSASQQPQIQRTIIGE